MRRFAFAIIAIALSFAGVAQAQPAVLSAIPDAHLAATLERLDEGRIDELRASVSEYRARLASLSRETSQAAWATTQEELGNILLALAFREYVEMIRQPTMRDSALAPEAESAFSAALAAVSREEEPSRWAGLHVKLAMVSIWQPNRYSTADAVAHLRAALPAYSQSRARVRWATTQILIAHALQYSGRNNEAALQEGIAAADAAAAEFGAIRMTAEQNAAQGIAEELERMQGEVSAFRERVSVFAASNPASARAADPLRWARESLMFAEALLNEAEVSRWDGIGAYSFVWRDIGSLARGSLDVISRESAPEDWARAQHDLGRALHGEGGDRGRRDAVTAYRAALTVLDQQRGSDAWARSQANLMKLLFEISRSDETAGPEALTAAHLLIEHRNVPKMGDLMEALEIVSRFEGQTRADELSEWFFGDDPPAHN